MFMQIDIDAIQYNLQSAFHMLRHFETATPEINSTLINKGYSQKDIDNELSLVGSKFNEAFATDISGLLERFKQYSFIETIGLNGNLILECNVPVSDFPNGIGTQAVISIQDIPENERRFIYLKKNREVELLHYKVSNFPTANVCTLILKPVKKGYLFISAFSGAPAMPIPLSSMDMALYSSCKKFWDAHVFLELKMIN